MYTPHVVKIASVELLKSAKRIGLAMLRKTTRKERKELQGKDHMTIRKCDAKKSLVIMLDRLSFL